MVMMLVPCDSMLEKVREVSSRYDATDALTPSTEVAFRVLKSEDCTISWACLSAYIAVSSRELKLQPIIPRIPVLLEL